MQQCHSKGRIGVDVEETDQHEWNDVFNVVQMISENKTSLSVYVFPILSFTYLLLRSSGILTEYECIVIP